MVKDSSANATLALMSGSIPEPGQALKKWNNKMMQSKQSVIKYENTVMILSDEKASPYLLGSIE